MRRKNRLVRLFRALSGASQREFGERTGVHPVLLAQYELDQVEPSPDHVDLLARGAGLTAAAGEQILRFSDVLRRPRQRAGPGAEDLLIEQLAAVASTVHRSLLRLPCPSGFPKANDRHLAGELWALLEDLSEGQQLAVVRIAQEFQSWALVERACEESVVQASRNVERAASLARLAQEIAEWVRGPQGWHDRLRGLASAHAANVLRVAGELKAAETAFERAKRLWHTGSDQENLLDPGRLLDLEASLRRDQRRFDEAVGLLDDAITMGRLPGRALINKAFTLEVMGEHQRAIETLLQAESLAEIQGDPRLRYILHVNLALNLVQVGRFAEAAELASQVRQVAVERGDEIIALRVTWLDGRITAGLGRPAEARALLEEARRGFAARGMWYDVALAVLEIAVLLLDEGHTAEVKALAPALSEVFESKAVQREALASLRLFREAVEREEATAELARRLVQYLYRAQHDPELRFEAP